MNIPDITTSLLTNTAYGFPSRGNARRIKPLLLACLHITSNQNNLGTNAATNERNYANRTDSPGPSAHYYLNRDGSGVKAIDPVKYAAWSNGDVNTPNTTLFGYQTLKEIYLDNNFNANEAFLLEIESCGYGSTYPITKAQKETIAYLLATFSISQNIPISRDTVWAHSDVNSVTRANCPIAKASKENFLSEIISLANSYKSELIAQPLVKECQATVALLTAQVNQLQTDLAIANQMIIDLRSDKTYLQEELDSANSKILSLTLENLEIKNQNTLLVQENEALKATSEEYAEVQKAWQYLNDKLDT